MDWINRHIGTVGAGGLSGRNAQHHGPAEYTNQEAHSRKRSGSAIRRKDILIRSCVNILGIMRTGLDSSGSYGIRSLINFLFKPWQKAHHLAVRLPGIRKVLGISQTEERLRYLQRLAWALGLEKLRHKDNKILNTTFSANPNHVQNNTSH